MSLRDHVMAAMAKHHAAMKTRMPPLNRGTAGATPSKITETNKTGEAGDEDATAYAKKHRSLIKNKSENQAAGKSAKHPGFKAVQGKIQAEGYSQKIAGAILAARSRGASAAAHKSNLRLSRVKG